MFGVDRLPRAPPRETESGEAEAEQRERGGFGDAGGTPLIVTDEPFAADSVAIKLISSSVPPVSRNPMENIPSVISASVVST